MAQAGAKRDQSALGPMILICLLFSAALFAADNVLLDFVRAGWRQIQLIEASFAPTNDAQKLYTSSVQGKIPQADPRIIAEAARERQLKAPDTFKPPSN
jgi:hypothetical protein